MSLWQQIKHIFRRNSALKSIKNASESYERFRSWFEPTNIFLRRSQTALASNETIFAAVSRLSNSMATLPLKLYKDFRPQNSTIGDLLSVEPNPNMTSFDFIRLLETHRDTDGNGYAMKEYNSRYQVAALWILDPNKVMPVIEKATRQLWYEIQGDNGRYYVHNLDIIHVKHINMIGPGGSIKGISPISVLTNTTDFDAKVKEFTLEQVDGAIKASFILKMAAMLKPDKKKEILENFKSFYQENGGVLIQEPNTEIIPIENKLFVDTKVFEVDKITIARVASVYNMPKHMLGNTEGANYSSMEQMGLEYLQFTLLSIIRQYEQEFNRKLLTPAERQAGFYFKFNLMGLLRGDMKTKGEYYFKGVRSGMFKPNEIRAWEELPPEEGGDTLYVSRDMTPINQLGAKPPQ